MSAETVVHELDPPSGHLAHVVAAGAHPATVDQARGAARAMGADVVEVADRGVAEGIAATAAVADPNQVTEHPVETPAAGISADQTAGGCGEQAPPPAVACGIGEDLVDDLGRERAVPGDVGGAPRFGVDQRTDRQHDADLD